MVFNCFTIFSAVSGRKLCSKLAPTVMDSVRLYSTSARRSWSASSFASTHGVVSSMYLLQRRNRSNTAVIASATRSLSIFSCTLSLVPVTTAFKSSSTSSAAPVFLTTPSKYLLLMEIVLFTRFPKILARSELNLSITSSHVMTPSFSNGIS